MLPFAFDITREKVHCGKCEEYQRQNIHFLSLEDRHTSIWSKEFEDINAHNVLSKLNTLTFVLGACITYISCLGFGLLGTLRGSSGALMGDVGVLTLPLEEVVTGYP